MRYAIKPRDDGGDKPDIDANGVECECEQEICQGRERRC